MENLYNGELRMENGELRVAPLRIYNIACYIEKVSAIFIQPGTDIIV